MTEELLSSQREHVEGLSEATKAALLLEASTHSTPAAAEGEERLAKPQRQERALRRCSPLMVREGRWVDGGVRVREGRGRAS